MLVAKKRERPARLSQRAVSSEKRAPMWMPRGAAVIEEARAGRGMMRGVELQRGEEKESATRL